MSVIRLTVWLCLALAAGWSVSSANAQSIWTNTAGTWLWNDAADWATGVPSPTIDALFNSTSPGGTPIVITGATPNARHIAFGSSNDTLSPVAAYVFNDGGAGELRMNAGGFLQNYSDAGNVQTFNVAYNQTGTSTINAVGGGFTFNNAYTVGGTLSIADGAGGSGSKPIQFNGGLTGAGAINITATNANVALTANNSLYTGVITVNSTGGVLTATNSNAFGTIAGNTVISGGTSTGAVALQGGITTAEPFRLNSRSGAAADAPQIISLSGANTITGNFTNFSGSASNTGGNGSSVIIESRGTAPGDLLTIQGSMNHGVSGQVHLLKLTGAGNGLFSGNITANAGNWNVVKNGAGTWTLSGANNVDGSYTVNSGNLILDSNGSDAVVQLFVNNGGTLTVNKTLSAVRDLNVAHGGIANLSGSPTATFNMINNGTLKGGGSITGSVVDLGGGNNIIAPGDSGTGTLAVSGNFTFNGGSTLQYDLGSNPAGTNDKITVGGNLNLFGSTTVAVTPINGALGNGNYTLFNYTGSLTGDQSNLFLTGLPFSPRQTYSLDTSVAHQVNLDVVGNAANLTWVGGLNSNAWDVNGTVNWTGATGPSPDNHFFDGDSVNFTGTGSNSPDINVAGAVAPGNVTFSNSAGHDYTLTGGNITVTGNFSSSAAGNVTFTNADVAANGSFTQSGTGTLIFSNFGAINIPTITINSGAVAVNRTDDATLTSALAGSGNFQKLGTNTLTLSGNSTVYTGNVLVSSGTLKLGSANALGTSAGITTVANGATLDLNGQNAATEAVTISGNGTDGNGALVNTSQTTFAHINGVTLSTNATFSVIGGASRSIMFIDGAGAFLQGNGHDLTVKLIGNASNEIDLLDLGETNLGNFTVDGGGVGGSLYLGGTTTLGSAPGTVTLTNNGKIGFYAASVAHTKPLLIDATGGGIEVDMWNNNPTDAPNLTIASPVTLAGSFTFNAYHPRDSIRSVTLSGKITGPGAFSVHASSQGAALVGLVQLTSNDNDFSGPITIGGGLDAVTDANDRIVLSIGNGGATGKLGTGDVTINSAGTLRFNRADTYTVANNIYGTGSVATAAAGGVVTLTGNNNYAGTTSVNAGTLLINGTHSGGADYTVATGATLGGTGTISSNVVVNAGGFIAANPGVSPFTIGGATIAGTLNVGYNGDTSAVGQLNISGALDISAASIAFGNLGVAALHGGPYVLATYGFQSGPAFAFTSITGLPAGYAIDYAFNGNEIALVQTVPGDFNNDGLVNGVDFGIWQNSFPTTSGGQLGTGDADGDGDVDGADFIVWQTHYPTPANPTAAVPEPQSIILALGSLASLALIRRRAKNS